MTNRIGAAGRRSKPKLKPKLNLPGVNLFNPAVPLWNAGKSQAAQEFLYRYAPKRDFDHPWTALERPVLNPDYAYFDQQRSAQNAAASHGRAKGKHLGRKLIALAAAIAVPAFAAPSEWHSFGPVEQSQAQPALPMPYEVAGESFPGSAFYYLADEPYTPLPVEGLIHGDAEPAARAITPLPGARAFAAAGTADNRARALKCMSLAIYYEAASESDAGQRAVAQVVLNRVAHPTYPASVCGVVFQGSERKTGCQFSFTCDGSLARKPSRRFWDRAERVARAALGGAVYTPVGLATHYHTVQVHPYWADSLAHITTIGAHRFYNWKGAAGRANAFTMAYAGYEPAAARHSPAATSPAEQPDPLELARIYEARFGTQPAMPGATLKKPGQGQGQGQGQDQSPAQAQTYQPRPTYTDAIEARGGEGLYTAGKLPASGTVKAQYANSGQWIAKP